MQRQKTIEVNGERVRIVAHERTYTGNKCGFNVRVNGTRHFVNCLSFDEAMDKALARYLGTERSTAMAKQKKATKATGRGKDARVAKTAAKATKATKAAPGANDNEGSMVITTVGPLAFGYWGAWGICARKGSGTITAQRFS